MKKFYFTLFLLFTAIGYSQKPCPGLNSVNYDGTVYHTEQIGTQCWLTENLNAGSMVQTGINQTNNNAIEKYCYNDQPSNCQKYGGLYQWPEAMQYNLTEGTKGICPTGWHVPTLADIAKLESTIGNHGSNLIDAGLTGGTKLSGFSALLSDGDNPDGSSNPSIPSGLWSSKSFDNMQAYYYYLNNNHRVVNHSYASKETGYTVRCINDLAISSLPVELNSFSVSVNKNNVLLKWNTATEVNSLLFEIEKKEVNKSWQKIASVPASGNSNSPKYYSYTDNCNTAGDYSYRLKMIDVDGAQKYSSEVNALIKAPDKFELSQNFPNPWNPSTTISYKVPENILVTIKLYDALGKEITTLINEEQPAGIHTVTLNENGLRSGVYYYQMRAGNFIDSKKINLIK